MTSGNRYRRKGTGMVSVLILLLITMTMIIPAVWAASDSIQASMGDVIPLHGVSYSGNTVYLFLTGPNLPANGVSLNDITQQADQGSFTMVDVDADQRWSYRWNTARLQNRLDYGTYTIYVVTDPVDRSRLGGHTYSTLEVYLTRPGLSDVSVVGGTSYTLNVEDHGTTAVQTTASQATTPPPPPTPAIPVESATLPPQSSSTPLQKSGTGDGPIIVAGCAIMGGLALFRRKVI
ncbi:MAG: hypothetical protein NTV10_05030 [Methanoregula sp.]|nr:hypothetical protein [Methanoregula sp.]